MPEKKTVISFQRAQQQTPVENGRTGNLAAPAAVSTRSSGRSLLVPGALGLTRASLKRRAAQLTTRPLIQFGWLKKQTHGKRESFRRWNKRWFILATDALMYGREENGSTPTHIMFKSVKAVQLATHHENPSVFEIPTNERLDDGSQRIIVLKAKTPQLADQWVDTINSKLRSYISAEVEREQKERDKKQADAQAAQKKPDPRQHHKATQSLASAFWEGGGGIGTSPEPTEHLRHFHKSGNALVKLLIRQLTQREQNSVPRWIHHVVEQLSAMLTNPIVSLTVLLTFVHFDAFLAPADSLNKAPISRTLSRTQGRTSPPTRLLIKKDKSGRPIAGETEEQTKEQRRLARRKVRPRRHSEGVQAFQAELTSGLTLPSFAGTSGAKQTSIHRAPMSVRRFSIGAAGPQSSPKRGAGGHTSPIRSPRRNFNIKVSPCPSPRHPTRGDHLRVGSRIQISTAFPFPSHRSTNTPPTKHVASPKLDWASLSNIPSPTSTCSTSAFSSPALEVPFRPGIDSICCLPFTFAACSNSAPDGSEEALKWRDFLLHVRYGKDLHGLLFHADAGLTPALVHILKSTATSDSVHYAKALGLRLIWVSMFATTCEEEHRQGRTFREKNIVLQRLARLSAMQIPTARDKPSLKTAVRGLVSAFELSDVQRVCKQFAHYVDVYCSGPKFSLAIRSTLLAMMVQSWEECLDPQDVNTEVMILNQTVRLPFLWRSLFLGLRKSTMDIRRDTLRDINALLINNPHNCLGIMMVNTKWPFWVLSLLEDLPVSVLGDQGRSTDPLAHEVYALCINIFVCVLWTLYAQQFTDEFRVQLAAVCDCFVAYGGIQHNTQVLTRVLLSAFTGVLCERPMLMGSVKMLQSILTLTDKVKQFIFRSAEWKDTDIEELHGEWAGKNTGGKRRFGTGGFTLTRNMKLTSKGTGKGTGKMKLRSGPVSKFVISKRYGTEEISLASCAGAGLHWEPSGGCADLTLLAKTAEMLRACRLHSFDASLMPVEKREGQLLSALSDRYQLLDDSELLLSLFTAQAASRTNATPSSIVNRWLHANSSAARNAVLANMAGDPSIKDSGYGYHPRDQSLMKNYNTLTSPGQASVSRASVTMERRSARVVARSHQSPSSSPTSRPSASAFSTRLTEITYPRMQQPTVHQDSSPQGSPHGSQRHSPPASPVTSPASPLERRDTVDLGQLSEIAGTEGSSPASRLSLSTTSLDGVPPLCLTPSLLSGSSGRALGSTSVESMKEMEANGNPDGDRSLLNSQSPTTHHANEHLLETLRGSTDRLDSMMGTHSEQDGRKEANSDDDVEPNTVREDDVSDTLRRLHATRANSKALIGAARSMARRSIMKPSQLSQWMR